MPYMELKGKRVAVLIDTLYQDGANAVAGQLAKEFPAADIGVFQVLCQIGRGDI